MPSSKSIIPADYARWLTSLKSRISSAQQYAEDLIGQQPVDQLAGMEKRKGRKMIELEYILFASSDKIAREQP